MDEYYFATHGNWELTESITSPGRGRTSSVGRKIVGRALDCGAGGRGFDSRDRTNTQGLKIP